MDASIGQACESQVSVLIVCTYMCVVRVYLCLCVYVHVCVHVPVCLYVCTCLRHLCTCILLYNVCT